MIPSSIIYILVSMYALGFAVTFTGIKVEDKSAPFLGIAFISIFWFFLVPLLIVRSLFREYLK